VQPLLILIWCCAVRVSTGDISAADLRMLGSKLPVWSLPRAQPGGGACLSMSAWGPDQDPWGLVLNRPIAPIPPSLANQAPGGAAAAMTAAARPHVRLQDLVAVGGKEGGIVLVDAQAGTLVQAIDKVHWQLKRGALGALLGVAGLGGGGGGIAGIGGGGGHNTAAKVAARTGVGGPPPPNAVGAPVTEVVCVEGGMLSGGADGVVRYHPLAALTTPHAADQAPLFTMTRT
jgi:hypothetical protein